MMELKTFNMINYDKDSNKNEKDYEAIYHKLEAKIRSSDGDTVYHAQVELQNGLIKAYGCECPQFSELKRKNGLKPMLCKHIHASLMKSCQDGHVEIKKARLKACKRNE